MNSCVGVKSATQSLAFGFIGFWFWGRLRTKAISHQTADNNFFTFQYIHGIKPRHLWLTPAILAIWEAEIRRVTVRGQSRQKVGKTPTQPQPCSTRWPVPIIPGMWEAEMGRLVVPAQPSQKNCQDSISMGKSWVCGTHLSS
jgi:hypothetical protein